MAAKLGSLVVDIAANVATLKKDMETARTTVEGAMEGISRAAETAKHALEAIGVGFSLFEIGKSIKEAIEFGDKLKDMATATGASVEQLSFLDYVAKQSNTSLDALAGGIGKLQKNLAEVSSGAGAQNTVDALRLLKLNAADLAKLDVVKQLTTIGDALQGLANPAQRAQAAAGLFSKSFQELLPFLLEGSQGLQDMLERFIELDGQLTGKQAGIFDGFNDGLGELRTAARGAAIAIATDISPALTDFVRWIATEVPKATDFIRNLSDSLIQGFLNIGKASKQIDLAIWQGLQTSLGKIPGFGFQDKIDAAKKAIAEIDRVIEESQKSQDEKLAARKKAQADAIAKILSPPQPPALEPFDSASVEAKREAELRRREAAEIAENGRVLNMHLQAIDEESRYWEARERKKESLRQQVETTPEKVLRELKEFQDTFGVNSVEYGRRAAQAYDELIPPIKEATNAGKELGLVFSSAFEDAIAGGKSFGDVLKSLAQDIEKMIARNLVTKPLESVIGSLFDQSNGSSGGFGKLLSGLFGSPKASGGTVYSGKVYPVGEAGPELFAPGVTGTIIPNSALGGGGSLVVNITNTTNTQVKTRDRGMVGGKRVLDLAVVDSVGRSAGTGLFGDVGIRPPLAGR